MGPATFQKVLAHLRILFEKRDCPPLHLGIWAGWWWLLLLGGQLFAA